MSVHWTMSDPPNNRRKNLSTIGIEGFIIGPSHPLPPTYDTEISSSSSSSPLSPPLSPSSSSFTSWEIRGAIKVEPADFVVREILPKQDAKFSKIIAHYQNNRNTNNDIIGGDVSPSILMASMLSGPPTELSLDNNHKSNSNLRAIKTDIDGNGNEPIQNVSIEGQEREIVSSKPVSEEEIIQSYLEQVASPKFSAISLRQSLERLEARAANRIPITHKYTSPRNTDATNGGVLDGSTSTIEKSNGRIDRAEVWIPPLRNVCKGENVQVQQAHVRKLRRDFHRAIRIVFPFLKTESSIYNASSSSSNNNHQLSTSQIPTPASMQDDQKKGTISESTEHHNEDQHWIQVTVDNCFDGLIEYLLEPQIGLRRLYLFRNRGFEGAKSDKRDTDDTTISSTDLRLRLHLTKDDRRQVHHILALKNKHFESTVRNQRLAQDSDFKLIVVTWKKQSLRKGARKNDKRKRSENDGSYNNGSDRSINGNILCVLKKTQKEHLSAVQILSRNLRCRQSDIGFAGIKDMQAITYQFITIRNMNRQRANRTFDKDYELCKHNVELKVICFNVDFFLDVGDLEGNYFEITIRNLKRVQVDRRLSLAGVSDPSEIVEESFVDCLDSHVIRMVERVEKYGFINFYGEQRIGSPGTRAEVGVRGFEIGLSMLKQDFSGAIELLMEGKKYRESSEHTRRVRQVWRDSGGNPSATLKAFRGADIMPRERAVLKGMNRYPNNPLESIRFISYSMRMFYINAYQSFIFNQAASRRIKLFGAKVIKGDLYFGMNTDKDYRGNVKLVDLNEVPPIEITQVVLPLPGYDVKYPENQIGQLYRDLLEKDNVKFEKKSIPESTAKGSYRKLIVRPGTIRADIVSSNAACTSLKLSFQLPKGSYATMLLRELMLTTSM